MINNNLLRRGASNANTSVEKKPPDRASTLRQALGELDLNQQAPVAVAKTMPGLPRPTAPGVRTQSAPDSRPHAASADPAADFDVMAHAHLGAPNTQQPIIARELLKITMHAQGLKTVFLSYSLEGTDKSLMGAHNVNESKNLPTKNTMQHTLLATTLAGQLRAASKLDPALKNVARGASQCALARPGTAFKSIAGSVEVHLGGTRLEQTSSGVFTLTPSGTYGFRDVPEQVLDKSARFYANMLRLADKEGATVMAGHAEMEALALRVRTYLSPSDP